MLKKNDFIELEYVGKIKDSGLVFDTNIEKEAKEINLDIKTRPLIICLGQGMVLPAIDDFLIGKDTGKYSLTLSPEKAFGKRVRDLIKTIPLSVFANQNIKPQPGMVFAFDSLFGKVISTGSRVIVDFNNPIAGKEVEYDLNVKRKIEEENEKVKSLILTFFRKSLEFEIKDRKLIIKCEEGFKNFADIF